MTKIIPRPYQIDAVENTLKILTEQPGANPIVATPPGGGKSLIIAWTMRALFLNKPLRLINLTHVKELIEQDAKALESIWPNAPFGVYSAGLNSRLASMPITIASVQSAYRNVEQFGKVDGIFIDEAHLLSPSSETMYQKIIAELRLLNPDLFIAGYSATPWRMKHGLLTEGNIFNCVAFDNTQKEDFVQLIDDGYLVPLIPKHTSFQFDVSQIRKTAGDFNQGELQAAVNIVALSEQALQEAVQVARDRKHWLVFCSGIDHVESVTGILCAWGERAVYVHSKMNNNARDNAIRAYRSGEARMIVNDGVLTTGFDAPHTDCIVLLKPTASPGLHVQILGRGIRPVYADSYDLDSTEGRLAAIKASGRHNCLVLDFAGNTMRLGPINDPQVPKAKGKGTGEVPVKLCPECGTYVHAAQRFCTGIHWDGRQCDHEFQFETKLDITAATEELIARDAPVLKWFKVDRVEYEHYQKQGKPLMMRVHYYSGIRRFTEFVCIEHQNYAGKVARDWWRERLPNYPPPPTTTDGLSFVQNLPKPKWIYVHVNLRHPRILSHSFDAMQPDEIKIAMPQGYSHEISSN